MSTEFDTLLTRYLDGELAEDEIRRFAQLIQSDPAVARDVAAFEGLEVLLTELREQAPPPPVEDPVGRTMARLATRPPPRRPLGVRISMMLTAGPWRMAFAGGSLLVLGILVGLGAGRVGGPATEAEADRVASVHDTPETLTSPETTPDVMVHFVLAAPDARRVSVVGDFNGWDALATPLEKVGDVWRAAVPLNPGRYEYQFVVDGETWVVDPAAPRTVDDGFGGRNGVLEV